jgi:outer membrane protein assembly factor BamA
LPNYVRQRPAWSTDLNALYDKTRDVLTFTSTRTEGSAGLTDQITPSTSFHYRYVYRHVVASDLQVEPEEIPLFSQPTDVAFFSVSWLRERRDSPADPTRGSFNTADVDYASRSFLSSASFLRATFQNSTYTHISRRLVFARSTRVGIEQTLGGTMATRTFLFPKGFSLEAAHLFVVSDSMRRARAILSQVFRSAVWAN